MHFREYPLLNTPHLMLLILREAEKGAATVESCLARLNELFAITGEHPPYDAAEIRGRLGVLCRYLAEARLIGPAEGEGSRLALTTRGHEAIAAHPQGFDLADLMAYPEFAGFIRGLSRARSEGRMDPRTPAYDEGFAAYGAGALLADNPHPTDSVDHLAWENGWFEALDEASP